MVKLEPFKATTISPGIDSLESLICPVYDTIDLVRYNRYAKEKNNVIHFTTRKEDMPKKDFVIYAKENLDRFFKEGVLQDLDEDAFYIYGVIYSLPEELLNQIPKKDRREKYFIFGLVSLVAVEGLGCDTVVGHENVFEVNTSERYDLMKKCGMNFSPILAEYSMPKHDLNNILEEYLGIKRPELKLRPDRMPLVDVMLDCSRHLLWKITDRKIIKNIQDMMRDKKIMILDGHHRYTASVLLKKKEGVDYTMIMLVEGGDRALLLLPWHRCLKNCDMEKLWGIVNEKFKVESFEKSDFEGFYHKLRRENRNEVKIGMYDGMNFYILHLDKRTVEEQSKKRDEIVGLDLIIMHEWLIEPTLIGKPEDVSFVSLPSKVTYNVDNNGYDVAFFSNLLKVEDVEFKAHEERKHFPQKSTYFLPKVAEGIVMRRFG